MKNNMKKVLSLLLAVLMTVSLSVTAFAATGDFTGDTLGPTDMEAYYKIVHEADYTDVSAVKLAWSVPVVKYVNTSVITWNTETLKWVESTDPRTNDNTVSFTLSNYGSYAVDANVSFSAAVANSAAVSFNPTNGSATLQSIVNSDSDHTLKVVKEDGQSDEAYLAAKKTYIDDTEHGCKATISGTVTLTPANLSANSGKLGTYTVSISQSAS